MRLIDPTVPALLRKTQPNGGPVPKTKTPTPQPVVKPPHSQTLRAASVSPIIQQPAMSRPPSVRGKTPQPKLQKNQSMQRKESMQRKVDVLRMQVADALYVKH